MQAFQTLRSTFITVPIEHIDTDQIIPARFLTQTHKDGLGAAAFYDWRFDAKGQLREGQVLNERAGKGDEILVAGKNFGCGSSREHAVWALQGYGLRVVISPSIGDIFKSNALKNGLLPLEVETQFYEKILAQAEGTLTVDLEQRQVRLASGEGGAFAIEAFARLCLLQGVDQLGYLLAMDESIAAYERKMA